MFITTSKTELLNFLNQQTKRQQTLGFVPTMGALHKGHIELVKQSKIQNNCTIVSIFVNPKQFNNSEDFNKYPIQTEQDITLLNSVDCDVLFLPSNNEIYSNDLEIDLNIDSLNNVFEGPNRPGHFKGVVEVVYRFFDLIQPHKAYLGLKDFQQCLVIKTLRDRYFENIELIFCETIRENSGLAMSSRNARLSEQGKILASNIFKVLKDIENSFNKIDLNGTINKAELVLKNLNIDIEYLSLANAKTLNPSNDWQKKDENVVLIAAYIENVRLIDNIKF